MKLLVIGKEGRLAAHTKPENFAGREVVYVPIDAPDDEILAKGADADYILCDAMGRLSGTVMAGMKNLKMIHSEGVGYQGIDTGAAAARGIYVCNCKGMNAKAVAEHAIMLMLACLRSLVRGHNDVLSGNQIARKEQYLADGSLRELSDCVIGIVGFGDIGRETARLAAAFGAKCLYYNRSAVPAELCSGAERRELDELLGEADIVSVSLPLNPATKGMASDAFFAKIKDGAVFINTARGEIVDSAALIRALQSGKLSMAGLDTIAGEPVGKDNILVNAPADVLEKLILSPHIAGITGSSLQRGYDMFWESINRMEAGERPLHIVNGL